MWKLLASFGQYFYASVMPVRFRRSHLEARATQYMDRGFESWEHPDQLADMAAKDAQKELDNKARQTAAASQAAEEAKSETGQTDIQGQQPAEKKNYFWLVLRWIIHFLLVGLILLGLYYLNWWLGIPKLLRSEWTFLHNYWLPLLFFILYLLMWLGGWLWQLTGPDHVGNEYPDINQAWDIAIDTLYRSGIDIRQAPVFLVLGRTEAPANHMFGTTLKLRISTPTGNVTPIRIYASQDRIFITCPGTSLLARQARVLTQQAAEDYHNGNGEPLASGISATAAAAAAQGAEQFRAPASPAPATAGTEGGQNGASPAPASPAPAVPASAASSPQTQAVATEPQPAEAQADLWSEEDKRVMGLLTGDGRGLSPKAKKISSSFLKDPAEVRLLSSRLQHLCRLLARDRKPYCPLNGILVLVPLSAVEDDTDASQTATACRYDLMVIRQTLQIQCPIFALVCDMEKSDNFRQFLHRLPSFGNISRLGQTFPLYPDVEDREIPHMVETGTTWLTDGLLPSLVYNLFRLETPVTGRGRDLTPAEALEGNIRLYRFVAEMRERRKRLARLLTRGLLLDVPRAFFFGGVYLASTGQQLTAFLNGVFLRLLQSQNFVSWTPETLSADRRFSSLGWFFIGLNVALLIAGPILAYVFWPW